MKKFFTILAATTASLMISVTAYARPMFFGNPVYDLKGLNHVKVAEIVIPYDANINVDMAQDKMLGAIHDGAQKAKIQVLDVRRENSDVNTIMKVGSRMVKGGYLQVTVKTMGITVTDIPGYWHKVTKYKEHTWYDSNNKKHVDKTPYEVDEWVPESQRKDGHISIQYKLYDGENMDVYATCTDTRDKEYCEDVSGMLKRSAADFFKAIRKANK